jgi:hypothetical protein
MASNYVQSSGTHQTNAPNLIPIPGLELTLPEGVQTEAIVILNVPNPYATGDNSPGAYFGIAVDGKALPMFASFTYRGGSLDRVPTTLVVGVGLTMKPQKIQGMWSGIRGSTVFIDTPTSLCYIF